MAYLKYDTEVINTTKEEYRKCIVEMKALKTDMQGMVDKVKDAWKSDAGEAFFEKYNDEWLKGFTQYTQVLSHMAKLLDYAESKYSEVTEKAKALNI